MTDYQALAAAVISKAFDQTADRITPTTLTTSTVPPKRDGKRHNDRVKWRGEFLTKDFVRSIFVNTIDAEFQTDRLPKNNGPRWDGIVGNQHTPNDGCGRVS